MKKPVFYLTAFFLPVVVFSNMLAAQCTFQLTQSSFSFDETSQTHTWVFDGTGIQENDQNNISAYGIRYRIVGTAVWTNIIDYKYINNDKPSLKFDFRIAGLLPCLRYEFQITCNRCDSQPSPPLYFPVVSLNCWFSITNKLNNGTGLSEIFTVDIPGPSSQTNSITNFQILSAPTNNSFEISWDAVPSAISYSVQLQGIAGCTMQKTIFTNSITIQAPTVPSCNAACLDYSLKVIAFSPCGAITSTASSPSLNIHFGECTSYISEIIPGSQDALVKWKVLRGNPVDFSISWWKKSDLNNVFSTSSAANSTQVVLQNLEPLEEYLVNVGLGCSSLPTGCVATQDFRTTCYSYEPNNALAEAVPVPYGVEINSAIGNGDIDYYSFVPTCHAIWVDKSENNILFKIFKDGIEVAPLPLDDLFFNPPVFYQTTYHYYSVTPNERYQIRFDSNNPSNYCYSFKIRGANNWLNIASDMQGDFSVNLEAASENRIYNINNTIPASVDWKISGPATIIANYGDNVEVYFSQTGSVILTAIITNCEGTTKIVTKNIVVDGTSSPCNLNSPKPTCTISGPNGEVCSKMTQAGFQAAITGSSNNYTSQEWVTSSSDNIPLTVFCPTCAYTNISGFTVGQVYTIGHLIYCGEQVVSVCTDTVMTSKSCNTPQIFPNPVKLGSKLYIWVPDSNPKTPIIKVFDVQGKAIAIFNDDESFHELEISQLSTGTYFVNFIIDGKSTTEKFTVTEW